MTRSTRLRLLIAVQFAILSTTANAATPTQFIAKMYTEALGRAPDQAGWRNSLNHFGTSCSQSRLRAHGRSFYLSAEFSNKNYGNPAKLLTLYRGVLNREPDPTGFAYWHNQLTSGVSWSTIVDGFFNSSEFAGLVPSICNSDSYSFGDAPVLDLPVTGSGFRGSQSQLQSLLNNTPRNGTVHLAQKAVVRLTTTLTIPANVTLSTSGAPGPTSYAKMGRLVRASTFSAEAVRLNPGAKLKNVWVDGQRGYLGFNASSVNVQMYGGSGTTVSESRLSNTAGNTVLKALGRFENRPCGSNTIASNLVTAYSSRHYPVRGVGQWADGLTIACENALVEYNHVLDATDVPIILFRSSPAIQRSIVRNNTILNAGNSAYGGLAADPFVPQGSHQFSGSSFENNLIWTGVAHYDIALAVGTRAWFGSSSAFGYGISFVDNTSGTESVRADLGIGISGMLDVFVVNNTLNRTGVNTSTCPTEAVGASVNAGYASGIIQPYTDVLIEACIGH